jgi:hypothetical protein
MTRHQIRAIHQALTTRFLDIKVGDITDDSGTITVQIIEPEGEQAEESEVLDTLMSAAPDVAVWIIQRMSA